MNALLILQDASSVIITPSDDSGYSDQENLDKKIDAIEQDRTDIRVIIQSSLSISGLLLTISLGAIYFSYSSNSSVVPPIWTIYALFASTISISVSIFLNIYALRLKSARPIEKWELKTSLESAYNNERKYNTGATLSLLFSVIVLFVGMICFAWNQANGTITMYGMRLYQMKDPIEHQVILIIEYANDFLVSLSKIFY